MTGTSLFVLVLLCAIGGYVVVSLLFDNIRKSSQRPSLPEMSPMLDDPLSEARQVLGVSPETSQNELKIRYHELLAKYHPDKTQHLGEEFRQLAEQKTQQIVRAYELLTR